MEWKIFWLALYNLATKDTDLNEWDSLYARIWENENLKRIAYNVMRISYGSEPKKDMEWWKKFFRELMDFSTLRRKTQQELILMAKGIYNNYQETEIGSIYTHLISEMTK